MSSAEQVLNLPLNGREIREIILNRIRQTLDNDCRLSELLAVPSFQFRADIAIILAGAIHSEVNRQVNGGKGDESLVNAALADGVADIVTNHVEQGDMPPNEARIEGDVGVPVLGFDTQGRPMETTKKYSKAAKHQRQVSVPDKEATAE